MSWLLTVLFVFSLVYYAAYIVRAATTSYAVFAYGAKVNAPRERLPELRAVSRMARRSARRAVSGDLEIEEAITQKDREKVGRLVERRLGMFTTSARLVRWMSGPAVAVFMLQLLLQVPVYGLDLWSCLVMVVSAYWCWLAAEQVHRNREAGA